MHPLPPGSGIRGVGSVCAHEPSFRISGLLLLLLLLVCLFQGDETRPKTTQDELLSKVRFTFHLPASAGGAVGRQLGRRRGVIGGNGTGGREARGQGVWYVGRAARWEEGRSVFLEGGRGMGLRWW